jgi:capsular exopolysaccharide synthesis family protein
MAKHYEALQRAEQERKRRVAGEPMPVTAVEWDTTPATAPKRDLGLIQKVLQAVKLQRRPIRAEESANEMNKRRISLLQPESYAAEQFRTLRARLDSLATQQPLKTLAVTSANPDEGKSTASINLAAVTSMGVGRKVLLMDCDLRKPKIHRSLGLEPHMGLGEILLGQATFDEAVLKVEGLSLDVLPVRTPPSNPSELLASNGMAQLLIEVGSRYDQVILDTPACLGIPDTKTVTELCDGIILVVRADVTPRDDVQTVLEILDRRRVLGLLLNGAETGRQQYGYY